MTAILYFVDFYIPYFVYDFVCLWPAFWHAIFNKRVIIFKNLAWLQHTVTQLQVDVAELLHCLLLPVAGCSKSTVIIWKPRRDIVSVKRPTVWENALISAVLAHFKVHVRRASVTSSNNIDKFSVYSATAVTFRPTWFTNYSHRNVCECVSCVWIDEPTSLCRYNFQTSSTIHQGRAILVY